MTYIVPWKNNYLWNLSHLEHTVILDVVLQGYVTTWHILSLGNISDMAFSVLGTETCFMTT